MVFLVKFNLPSVTCHTSSQKTCRKKALEKLDMDITTKEYISWKKLWIKSDLGKKFIREYCLRYTIYKEKNESQWKKKSVKGNEKIKMVIEN